ncbi:MAG: HEAT repeat domain-containing protein, partial [Nitrospirae bacterium]|nr:HEAT repeat domain-containing protein [Nitrospirota bacterium]
TFVNDIEIDKSIIALFEKDNTSVFIGKEYQGDMDIMRKGVETRKDKIAETFRQECGEMTEDRAFSEVILELLQIDSISKEDYLKLLTKLSELVSDFLEMGMFQEICDMYNTIYSHSLSGRFKDEALSMVHYFFQSEQFIVRLVDALKFFGRYNREGAVKLTRVLRLYLIGPLLDALSDAANPTVRKFLITILSTFRSNVIPEAVIRLNDKRWYVVRNMIILIRECGGKDSLREVIPFTKNENKKVCTEALKTLLHFGDSEAPSCLKEYLKSDDMWLRDQAIILSGTYRVKDIVPDLIELLEKKDMFAFKSDCKISVIRALAQIGDPQAIEPLKRLYSSKTLLNREALNEIKVEIFKTLNGYPVDAIKPLIELGLKSKIEEIRSISKRLLEKVSP